MDLLNGQTQLPDAERVFAYFLGELPAEESDLFEAEVFQSEGLAEQVFAFEDELIELYLHDGLLPERRARFEQHYLTTEERRERVECAAAFEQELSDLPVPQPRATEAKAAWWQTLFYTPRLVWALLLLLAVLGGLWVMSRNRTPAPDEIARSGSPTPQPTATTSATVTPSPALPRVTPTVQPRPAPVVAITLTPGLILGSGQALPSLQLPAAAEAAELKLLLYRADFTSYRATLQTGGATVWTKRALRARITASGEAEVNVRVPARRLKRADYLLLLFGESAGASPQVASYSFSVLPH